MIQQSGRVGLLHTLTTLNINGLTVNCRQSCQQLYPMEYPVP